MTPGLRTTLATPGSFPIVVDVVPSHGLVIDGPARQSLAAPRDPVDSRVVALLITDGAGDQATMSPLLVAGEFVARGQHVIVYVACRDRSRIALLSLAWELEARGTATDPHRILLQDRASRAYHLAADLLTGRDPIRHGVSHRLPSGSACVTGHRMLHASVVPSGQLRAHP